MDWTCGGLLWGLNCDSICWFICLLVCQISKTISEVRSWNLNTTVTMHFGKSSLFSFSFDRFEFRICLFLLITGTFWARELKFGTVAFIVMLKLHWILCSFHLWWNQGKLHSRPLLYTCRRLRWYIYGLAMGNLTTNLNENIKRKVSWIYNNQKHYWNHSLARYKNLLNNRYQKNWVN